MIWIVIGLILCVVIIMLFLILRAKVNVLMECFYDEQDHFAYLRASLFGIKIFEKTFPFEQENEGDWERNILSSWKQMKKALAKQKKLMKKIKINQLTWKTEFGTGNAATAGLAAGGLWAMKGMIVGQICSNFSVKGKPDLQVFPDFYRAFFDSSLHCIGTITVGQAIIAYLQTPSTKNK